MPAKKTKKKVTKKKVTPKRNEELEALKAKVNGKLRKVQLDLNELNETRKKLLDQVRIIELQIERKKGSVIDLSEIVSSFSQ